GMGRHGRSPALAGPQTRASRPLVARKGSRGTAATALRSCSAASARVVATGLGRAATRGRGTRLTMLGRGGVADVSLALLARPVAALRRSPTAREDHS